MKALCIISHQKPLGNGRFNVYEAGIEYEFPDGTDAGPYFRPEVVKVRRTKAIKINE